MKAFVDKDLCIGCGICEEECSFVFRMDGDGKAVAITGEIPEEHVEPALSAKAACPVEAIVVG